MCQPHFSKDKDCEKFSTKFVLSAKIELGVTKK